MTEKNITEEKIRIPKTAYNQHLVGRLKNYDEKEAFLKAKENAKNRARILLPRALRVIAMEIEGHAMDVPNKKHLYKEVKNKIDLEMENYLTDFEKRRRMKIQSFCDAVIYACLFLSVASVVYFFFIYLMSVEF